MKKAFFTVFVVIAVVMVTVLSGCSQEAGSDGKKGDSKSGDVTLTVLINAGAKVDFLKDKVKPAFEKENPGVKLNVLSVPYDQYDSKLSTLIAGGTPPDVWSHWGQSGFADYYKRGLIADLSPFMDDFDKSKMQDKLLDIYNIDGKQHGIPFSSFTSFFYYNKELLDKAGIDYPEYKWNDPEWNWDKVVDMAKQLTKDYGKPNGVYGFTMNLGDTIDTYGWDWGADIYGDEAYKSGMVGESQLTGPKFIESVTFFRDLIFKEKVSPTADITQAAQQTGDPFVAGKVAMNMTGAWGLGNYEKGKMKFGVAPIPTGPAGTATPILYVDPLMISSKSKHPDEAWKLVKFLASTEAQKMWVEVTGFPPADTEAYEDWYSRFKDNIDVAYLKELNEAAIENGKESPNHLLSGYAEILTFLTNESEPIFLKNEDPKQLLEKMDPKFNDLLQRIKQKSEK
ncbi:ABC transporter substrate-binding protein [Numidum massiliense]|uniref:ABC transporter substrate-binding protein n=1 Tax=Numidum massiliense TaxID=1522315 RepID=UPI0006D59223|nr:sugar ABC transporter substrate-binding protein [Numidum massiliense]